MAGLSIAGINQTFSSTASAAAPGARTSSQETVFQAAPAKSDRVTISAEAKIRGQADPAYAVSSRDQLSARFEEEMRARLSTAKDINGRMPDAQEQDMLMRGLTSAVATIEREMGVEAAKAAMENVLKSTADRKVSAASIAAGFSEALSAAAETAPAEALGKVRDFLNKDDAYNFAANQKAADVAAHDEEAAVGLSYALNRFFGHKAEMTAGGAAKVYNFNGGAHWGRSTIVDAINRGERSPEVAGEEPIPTDPQKFSAEAVGQPTVDGLVNFLANELGDADAALFARERLSGAADFIGAVDEVVAYVNRRGGFEAAEKLVGHLNGSVKGAINANTDLTRASYGTVHFEGWQLRENYEPDPQAIQTGQAASAAAQGLTCHWTMPVTGAAFYHQIDFS